VDGSAADVGIVVVHFGDPQPTAACLAALRADPSACHRHIVVVDNAGNLTDSVADDAMVVRPGRNLGFGAGANAGVEALGRGASDTLVVLNNDVEVVDGFLDAAAAAVAAPGVGAAGGPLFLDRPGGTLWYAGGGVSWLTGTVRQSRSPEAAGRAREVGFIPGAALAVRGEAWRQVGGFDPGYFLYHEDLDLCLRLRRLGWRLRFEPAMAAVHRLGAATRSASRSPLYLEHMAATRLRPFRPLGYRLYLAVLHTGYVAVRVLAYATVVGGRTGREASRALLRGHRRALAALRADPLSVAFPGELNPPTRGGGRPVG
jgi:GT2 family glycosyltransferase